MNVKGNSIWFVVVQGLVNRICSLPDIDDLFWEKIPTPILDVVENPIHLKNLTTKVCVMSLLMLKMYAFVLSTLNKRLALQELKLLADEIRSELSSIMSKTQRSFKASLAAVELTIALHYVFHAPVDKILWDAGEQVTSQFLHFFRMLLFASFCIRMFLYFSILKIVQIKFKEAQS